MSKASVHPSTEDDHVTESDNDKQANGNGKVVLMEMEDIAAKLEKRTIMKNIILISLAFFCNFTAYGGLGKLQSSLHRVEGMGTICQSVTYATLVISCLFVPKPFISLVGHKWAMTISYSGYLLWMAANGYAVWGTMVTTSILVGLTAAPLWTAQCSYFTRVAVRYAKLSGETEDAVVARFFGIFFMFFQFGKYFRFRVL